MLLVRFWLMKSSGLQQAGRPVIENFQTEEAVQDALRWSTSVFMPAAILASDWVGLMRRQRRVPRR